MGEGGGEVGMFLDMLSTEMAKGRDFEVLQAYLAAFLRIHEVALIGHEGLQVCTAPTPEGTSPSLEDASRMRYVCHADFVCSVYASRSHHSVSTLGQVLLLLSKTVSDKTFGGCAVRPRL